MKHPLTWLAVFFVAFVAFLIVRTTDRFKEVQNPRAFWTEKVQHRMELLNGYVADVRKCTADIERLSSPQSRNLWIRQKGLEGMTQTEALADYRLYLENAIFACRIVRDIIPGAQKDLDEAS